jgi:hypothetical protein
VDRGGKSPKDFGEGKPLGRSVTRVSGFQRLARFVCGDDVGAVFCSGASCIARSLFGRATTIAKGYRRTSTKDLRMQPSARMEVLIDAAIGSSSAATQAMRSYPGRSCASSECALGH